MNTQTINLKPYEVVHQQHVRNKDTQQIELKDVTTTIDPRIVIYELMRAPGVFKSGSEVVEAVIIARTIRDAGETMEINDNDLAVVKKALDHFIAKPHDPESGKIALGGPDYEELILRIYS